PAVPTHTPPWPAGVELKKSPERHDALRGNLPSCRGGKGRTRRPDFIPFFHSISRKPDIGSQIEHKKRRPDDPGWLSYSVRGSFRILVQPRWAKKIPRSALTAPYRGKLRSSLPPRARR